MFLTFSHQSKMLVLSRITCRLLIFTKYLCTIDLSILYYCSINNPMIVLCITFILNYQIYIVVDCFDSSFHHRPPLYITLRIIQQSQILYMKVCQFTAKNRVQYSSHRMCVFYKNHD